MKLRSILTGVLLTAFSLSPAFAQTNQGSSPLSGAKGGTNNSFMQFTGPATSMKTFTLPNASDTIATLTQSQTLTNKTINCANNTCTPAAQGAYTLFGNYSGSSAAPAAIDITALTSKASPVTGDIVLIQDSAASNAFKKTTVGALSSAGSVASIAGNTGAFTLGRGITNSTNEIRLSLTNATMQATPGDPTGTTSSSAVMMGLGCSITPVYSGRLLVEITASSQNSANAAVNSMNALYGTGTAPSNGVTATGTMIGPQRQASQSGTVLLMPFKVGGIVTGLSPGTPYWFDMSLATSTGTASVKGVGCTIMEF